jgi:hypothetical protein
MPKYGNSLRQSLIEDMALAMAKRAGTPPSQMKRATQNKWLEFAEASLVAIEARILEEKAASK